MGGIIGHLFPPLKIHRTGSPTRSTRAGGGEADILHSGTELGARARKAASISRPASERNSETTGLTIGPEYRLQSRHNLPLGGPPASRLNQEGHQVGGVASAHLQSRKRRLDRLLISGTADPGDPPSLRLLDRLGDLQDLDGLLLVFHEPVDPDDGSVAGVDRLLELVSGIG